MKNQTIDFCMPRLHTMAGVAGMVICLLLPWRPTAAAGASFDTPQQLADAFVVAVARNDAAALARLLGEDFRRLLPDDAAEDELATQFLDAWVHFNGLEAPAPQVRMLAVGAQGWTLPIPILHGKDGWAFDTAAGAEMIWMRRIGRNELSAMQALLAYHDAQVEYAQQDHDGDGVLEYAQRFLSSPGAQDGLYWETNAGDPPSPLGPLLADTRPGQAYHGYHYRILTAQGPGAAGGSIDYRVGGNMTQGFAVIAWPAEYGETGIMSFMLNREGTVYEADLGPETARVAASLPAFDPQRPWSPALEATVVAGQ